MIKLAWQTENEQQTSHFEVEKSVDNAVKFQKIEEVKATGNAKTTPQYYSLLDAQPSFANYYRLKMVDTDGQFKYSKTVLVLNKKTAKIDLYPNPVNDVLNISWTTKTTQATVSLIDVTGKIIATQKQTKDKLTNAFSLDTRPIPNGIYTAMVSLDGEKSVYKVVIAR